MAGAAAFLAKHRTEEMLLAAIRGVAGPHAKQGRHDRTSADTEEEHTDDKRDRRDACGHPEMRRLPDGVFHCPACGSEVLPIGAQSIDAPGKGR